VAAERVNGCPDSRLVTWNHILVRMTFALISLVAQLAAVSPRQTPAVLSFPESGLDDPAAYRGYQTRFFRDAAGNTQYAVICTFVLLAVVLAVRPYGILGRPA